MSGKISIVVICVILATVSAEPVRRSIILPNDLSTLLNSKAELLEILTNPETIMSVKNILKSVIGYKITALSIVVKIVNWLASNFIAIAMGGTIALGICKITGKCSLNYDQSISKLCSFITPERMEMAQNLLMNAISRFGQEDEDEDEDMEFE